MLIGLWFSFHLRLKNFSKSKHKMGLHPRRSLNGVRSGKHMTRGKKTHSKTRKWLTHSGGEFLPLAVSFNSFSLSQFIPKTPSKPFLWEKPCRVSLVRTALRFRQIRSFDTRSSHTYPYKHTWSSSKLPRENYSKIQKKGFLLLTQRPSGVDTPLRRQTS